MELNKNYKKKNNKTIVFIHGNSSSSNVFQSIQDSELSYSTLTFDLLGHGNSPKSKNIKDYSILNHCKLSIELINSIEGDKVLVGNSYGGHIAIEIAEKINNLKGLVIFGTPPVKKPLNFDEAFSANDALPTFFSEKPELEQIKKAIEVCTKNQNVNDILVDDFIKTDSKVRVAIVDDVSNPDVFQDEYSIFYNLNIPKLILQGEFDPLISLDYIKIVIDESHSDFKLIKDCGHYISLEKPEEFLNIIKEFGTKCFDV